MRKCYRPIEKVKSLICHKSSFLKCNKKYKQNFRKSVLCFKTFAQKVCVGEGPEECRTVYESSCTTRWDLTTRSLTITITTTAGMLRSSRASSSETPAAKSFLLRSLSSNPENADLEGFVKLFIQICGAGCTFEEGAEECHDKVRSPWFGNCRFDLLYASRLRPLLLLLGDRLPRRHSRGDLRPQSTEDLQVQSQKYTWRGLHRNVSDKICTKNVRPKVGRALHSSQCRLITKLVPKLSPKHECTIVPQVNQSFLLLEMFEFK